jgi:hypothetical protein
VRHPGQMAPLAAVLVLGVWAAPASGQLVHGRVVDEGTGEGVSLARITAMVGDSVGAGPITADQEGRFRLRLPGPGRYHLRVERLGYPVHTTEELRAEAFEEVEVQVAIAPEPIPLAPLEVVARGLERGRDQFARRRATEDGQFVDMVHIALMRADRRIRQASDVVRDVEGLRVRASGSIRTDLGWGCLVVFLDHSPIPVGYSAGRFSSEWPPRLASITLNEAVDYRTVRGVEVYRTVDEVPEELRRGLRWQDVGRCGVVWFWTEVGW